MDHRILIGQINRSRREKFEKRQEMFAAFISSLDFSEREIALYQESLLAFHERFARVMKRYPKAPDLFR